MTIKSKGAEFTKVETSSGEAKIASSSLEGACAKEGGAARPEGTSEPAAAPAPLAFEEPGESAPAEGADATTSTPEPTAEDPDATTEGASSTEEKRIEPLADERKPAAEVPDVVEEGGGGGIGGWVVAGIGGAILAGGTTAAVFGVLPYFDNRGQCGASPISASGCPALDELRDDYTRADDDEARAEVARDAERLKTRIDNGAQQWDDQGRWLTLGGAIGAGVGLIVTVVGGIVAVASGGSDAEEVE